MHEKATASLISDIVFLQVMIFFEELETLLVFASKLKHAQLEELVFIHHFSSFYYGILHFTLTVFAFLLFRFPLAVYAFPIWSWPTWRMSNANGVSNINMQYGLQLPSATAAAAPPGCSSSWSCTAFSLMTWPSLSVFRSLGFFGSLFSLCCVLVVLRQQAKMSMENIKQ